MSEFVSYARQSGGLVWFMVLNTTFNNISVISGQSVLLVNETGGPGENHVPVAKSSVLVPASQCPEK
jgi:hypothetical protein